MPLIKSGDGEIGHVDDFIVDDETWAVRYMVVNTSNWWVGKKVLVAPNWIRQVSWPDSKAFLDHTRESVKGAPLFESLSRLDRQLETKLYEYYGHTSYWTTESRSATEARRFEVLTGADRRP
jgi:hypothetical protein